MNLESDFPRTNSRLRVFTASVQIQARIRGLGNNGTKTHAKG